PTLRREAPAQICRGIRFPFQPPDCLRLERRNAHHCSNQRGRGQTSDLSSASQSQILSFRLRASCVGARGRSPPNDSGGPRPYPTSATFVGENNGDQARDPVSASIGGGPLFCFRCRRRGEEV